MTSIKAIETVYNGHRFRSRLEARWAVFFNALGIEYQYETEGLDLGNGVWYLPDFWLPEQEYWLEIKPPPSDEWPEHEVFTSFEKSMSKSENETEDWLTLLGATEIGQFVSRFYILRGQSWVFPDHIVTDHWQGHITYFPSCESEFEYEGYIFGDNNYLWCECPVCGKIGLQFGGRSGRLCDCLDGKVYNSATPRLMRAYTAARQARFEHGQVGAPSEWKSSS